MPIKYLKPTYNLNSEWWKI